MLGRVETQRRKREAAATRIQCWQRSNWARRVLYRLRMDKLSRMLFAALTSQAFIRTQMWGQRAHLQLAQRGEASIILQCWQRGNRARRITSRLKLKKAAEERKKKEEEERRKRKEAEEVARRKREEEEIERIRAEFGDEAAERQRQYFVEQKRLRMLGLEKKFDWDTERTRIVQTGMGLLDVLDFEESQEEVDAREAIEAARAAAEKKKISAKKMMRFEFVFCM
jgi:hypothetical protein